jgi:hypothetical protein
MGGGTKLVLYSFNHWFDVTRFLVTKSDVNDIIRHNVDKLDSYHCFVLTYELCYLTTIVGEGRIDYESGANVRVADTLPRIRIPSTELYRARPPL